MQQQIQKRSLVRTRYFSSADNVLTSCEKIWHVLKRDVFQLNWLGSDQWIWRRCCDGDFNSASAGLPSCLSKDNLKQDFLDIHLTTFPEAVISEAQDLWGSSLFSKYLKFILDFRNSAKNWEKVFCFWDNCVWIGIVKLSLLRRGYFSSAVNVLKSSPKIWHVKNRDFFQLSRLGGEQWIW